MSLADDLRGPSGRQVTFKVDAVLDTLDDDDRTALEEALRDPSVTVNHIAKACRRNGVDLGNAAISNWRQANGVG